MKQALLLASCLIAFTLTYAQKVRIADTTYSSTDSGVTLHLSNTRQLRYNNDCNNDADDNIDYDVETGNVSQLGFDTIEFDKNKMAYRYTYQYFDSTTNQYQNSTRSTYTRNNANYITSQLNEMWDKNSWHTQFFDSSVYDANNDNTIAFFQVWNPYADTLQYAYRNMFTYDAAHHVLSDTEETYNYLPNVWSPTSLTLNTYDANGYLIKKINQTWNIPSASWVLYTTTNYYNNDKGLLDSSIITYPATYNTVQKWFYTYVPNTSQVFQSIGLYFLNNQLAGGSRNTYYNIDNDFEYLDSSLREEIDLSEVDSFSLEAVNVYHEFRNDDKSIHDYIHQYSYFPANFSSYNRTYYTYAPCASVLPVSLLSFTGTQKSNNALLQWQTTNDENTSSFTIMRSTDGIHFTGIGSRAVSGSHVSTKNYTYTDVELSSLGASIVYYKLAMVGKDGATTYSKIVQVIIAENQFHIVLSPNPVTNTLSVYSPVSMPGAVVKITDMSGKTLYTSRQNLTAGSKLNIDVSAFAKGMYMVTVQCAGNRFVFKISK